MHMSEVKERRQQAIAELIRNGAPASQEYLVDRLGELGIRATQATVSRDLEQLGAVKVRRAGGGSYALPASPSSTADLASVVRTWVRSIDAVGNLIVIKTPPGSAHLVGVVLDLADLAEIVGTICGDDTIFVACRSSSDARAVVAKLRSASAIAKVAEATAAPVRNVR